MVTYAAIGDTATFTPTAKLAPSTLFTATITTMVTDLAGNALAANYVWTFTTGAAPDTTPPEIVTTNPANAATNVPINQAVSATFSEAMNPLTITTATFGLTGPGGATVTGTVAYDAVNFIATFTPTASLAGNSVYTATVTTGATDLAGNPLGTTGAPNPWSFTTGVVVVPPPVNLGTAALFGGFSGGAGMTNQGTSTVINGDIGTTGVSTLITGFHDNGPNCIYTETPLNIGLVNGAIDTAPPPPTVGCPTEGTAITAAIAAQAAADALTAYNALVAFPNGLDVSTCPGCGGGSAGELGGRTLDAGIYKSAPGSYGITQGDLTLDAQGDPNAFWVFQMATTLTVGTPAASRNVLLVNGAQAKNVFWQVGSAATINGILGGGTMIGTIISQAAISVSTAGVAAVTTINGRAIGSDRAGHHGEYRHQCARPLGSNHRPHGWPMPTWGNATLDHDRNAQSGEVMNLRVRIIATVVVAISPMSMLSLHAQRMASLFDIATDGNGQSSTSSPPAPSVREPRSTPKSRYFSWLLLPSCCAAAG